MALVGVVGGWPTQRNLLALKIAPGLPYSLSVDLVSEEPDGSAVLQLSHQELVGYYNLLNQFLAPSTLEELTWAEAGGQLKQVRMLAQLTGMPIPPYAAGR